MLDLAAERKPISPTSCPLAAVNRSSWAYQAEWALPTLSPTSPLKGRSGWEVSNGPPSWTVSCPRSPSSHRGSATHLQLVCPKNPPGPEPTGLPQAANCRHQEQVPAVTRMNPVDAGSTSVAAA